MTLWYVNDAVLRSSPLKHNHELNTEINGRLVLYDLNVRTIFPFIVTVGEYGRIF